MAYHRPRREDAIKPSKKEIRLNVGSRRNSSEDLKQMCNDKSIELLKTIEINDGEKIDVVFWTTDIPELIGVSTFTKNAGEISYSIDFSLSTIV